MGLRRMLRLMLPAALSAAFLTGLPAPAQADAPVSSFTSAVGGDPADVYYPSAITERTPVALMLQGAQVGRAHYSAYARAVAAYGFIVVVPDHRRLLFFDDDFYPEQKQAAQTVAWMKAEDDRDGSPLEDRVKTTRLVLLGHSFGGAAGLSVVGEKCVFPFCTGLTYTMPTQVKAASLFGTNNKDYLTGAFATVDLQVPTQLVQGVQDGVALPADAETTYTKLTNDPKQIVRVSGTNHYGITDTQNPAGADPETGAQSLPQAQSIEIAARWAARFLLAAMGDAAAEDYVWNTGDAADPNVTVTGDD
ncbi:alpha/beta hydrolase family protein [Actinocorallia libanotica]|uniref:poly(ethylene terephthalate) hydrolase n=1 Tax=Actinocorallia libanotica TaxID=46162 RepID=A0ABN1QG72_9ACTN